MTEPIPAPEGCRYGIEPDAADPGELVMGSTEVVCRTPLVEREPPFEDLQAGIWCWAHRHWTTEGTACVIPDYGKEERT